MTAGALARVIRRAGDRRATAEQRCDLCGEAAPAGHRHLLDTDTGELLCSCQACSLLFDREAASKGHYRRVPQRRLRLSPVPTADLGVPVGLAFFVVRQDGAVLAHYPSPAGTTQWEVEPAVWRDVVEHCGQLRDIATDVEALLVNTAHGRQQHWLVPIDDCYRLVAVVRREWRGLSGGGTVWPEIDRFFGELIER